MEIRNPLSQDLVHILEHTKALWEDLREKKVFVTGGTGFLGKWLLESFAWANDQLDLNAQMIVLSRDPNSFKTRYPHLAEASGVMFHQGNVRDFGFPQERFDFIIHAATDASAQLNAENLLLSARYGTKRLLMRSIKLLKSAKREVLRSESSLIPQRESDIGPHEALNISIIELKLKCC